MPFLSFTPSSLLWLSVLCLGGGALTVGGLWLIQARRIFQQERHLQQLLKDRTAVRPLSTSESNPPPSPFLPLSRAGQWALPWLDSRLGRALVEQEDRSLLAQCGFNTTQSQANYLAWRLFLGLLLPLIALGLQPTQTSLSRLFVSAFVGLSMGLMLPKWYLRRRSSQRRQRVAKELPLLVDLLRLLQGAGMGLDQCLQLIAADFNRVLPILGREIFLANRLYASGRTREQAFIRLSDMFQSDNLADLTSLMLQIDRHGGAVQEPLRQFGERLREQRKADMKERIGKITVKMTAVMVVSLLPALMIITAGPGMLAVIRTLGAMQ